MERSVIRPLVAAFIVGVALAAGYVAARGSSWYQTGDFFCNWAGANFVVTGRNPYDQDAWLAATGGLYPDMQGGYRRASCLGRSPYPLWTHVAFAPLGLLPLELAATLWMALAICATLAGTYLAWRAARLAPARLPFLLALVICSQPFWVLLVGGQFSGLMLLLAAVTAWSVVSGHEAPGGAALSAMIIRPQIGALFAPVVLLQAVAGGRRRFIFAALAVGVALVGASLLVAPLWPLEWIGELVDRRLRLTALLPTAWGFAADVTGVPALGALLIVAVLVGVFAVGGRAAFTGLPLVGNALALSLFATPHIWSYDYLVLAVPWAITLAFIDRIRGFRRLLLLLGLVTVASALPWALYGVAFARGGETLSAVIPAATALLLAAALAGARDAKMTGAVS